MNQIELIKYQTKDAYNWVNKIVEDIPFELWYKIPDQLDTHVSWQVGHLLLSFNFHTIMVIRGHQNDLYQKFPIQLYARLFIKSAPRDSVDQIDPKALLQHLKIVQEKSLEIISTLSDDELYDALEPTDVPHPLAKNKLEALDWNIKHTMWHCGQLGILKRMVDQRIDFGLKDRS